MDIVNEFLLNKVKLKKDDIIVAGVSAGPDSMALLHILILLRKKINFRIIVAHVNHNVRKESFEEADFLENYCKINDVVFEKMIIEKYGDDNFQNEARNIRYSFYNQIIHKYHANYLMTGHHGDDLIETILMRIVRGSSLHGYSGFDDIVYMNDYVIVRPLIFFTKKELEEYDKKENVPYRVDKSNLKDKYTRNRYRMKILPFLKEEDPFVHQKFIKFSNILKEYDTFFNKIVLKEISNVYVDGIILIDKILKNDEIIIRRIIEYLLSKIYKDDILEIDGRHVDLVMKAIYSKKACLSFNLPNDYIIIKEYNNLYFKKCINDIMSYDIELVDKVFLPNGMILEKVISTDYDGNDILRLKSSDISLPLRVRTRKNGDKMTVKNMNGTKKISDILIDAKIPRYKRDSWPVVVDSADRIVWVPFLKKSKYNRLKTDNCDIIFKCLYEGDKL